MNKKWFIRIQDINDPEWDYTFNETSYSVAFNDEPNESASEYFDVECDLFVTATEEERYMMEIIHNLLKIKDSRLLNLIGIKIYYE